MSPRFGGICITPHQAAAEGLSNWGRWEGNYLTPTIIVRSWLTGRGMEGEQRVKAEKSAKYMEEVLAPIDHFVQGAIADFHLMHQDCAANTLNELWTRQCTSTSMWCR